MTTSTIVVAAFVAAGLVIGSAALPTAYEGGMSGLARAHDLQDHAGKAGDPDGRFTGRAHERDDQAGREDRGTTGMGGDRDDRFGGRADRPGGRDERTGIRAHDSDAPDAPLGHERE